tara:strand:- start:172 stop:1062 length:891 start_codon:yes stop_codon:yes gene_type:complete
MVENSINNIKIKDVDEAQFAEEVIEASKTSAIIVDFWAPWCQPCKQLTPVLEEVVKESKGEVILAKVNIDENQNLAGQLRIQSIPTVIAFNEGKIVNAFQGVLPKQKIIDFIEKVIGKKINKNFEEFYKSIKNLIESSEFENAIEALEEFLSENSDDINAIDLYLTCLVALNKVDEANDFIKSLSDKIANDPKIKSFNKKLTLKKKSESGPSLDELKKDLEGDSLNIEKIINLSEKYFSIEKIDECFDLLFDSYIKLDQKGKNSIKEKIVSYFNILGNENDYTKSYRKKLSSLIFS